MADTNFSDGVTVVQASWLNDVNDAIYSALGSGGVAPTTPTEVATNIGAVTAGSIHTGSSVTTPNDADELPILDSTSTFSLKKITWANVKATLKTYFDTLYQAAGSYGDVTGPASSVDSEVALFSGTGGKTIKRATDTGMAKLTSGVLSAGTAGTDYAKPDTASDWSASQKSSPITDNDLSFDLSGSGNNYFCTPTAGGALTFTNIASNSGKTGVIHLVNGSNYAITAHTNTKVTTGLMTTLSATGTYIVGYYCDGTNVHINCAGASA